jgi:hypothetical protein
MDEAAKNLLSELGEVLMHLQRVDNNTNSVNTWADNIEAQLLTFQQQCASLVNAIRNGVVEEKKQLDSIKVCLTRLQREWVIDEE